MPNFGKIKRHHYGGLDTEMSLLKTSGVLMPIRQYTGVPARWVRYTYELWHL